MKLHFASTDNSGCGHYRSFMPAKYLAPYFEKVTSSHGFKIGGDDIEEADVIFLQRHAEAFFVSWIPHARSLGKIIIYDLDDSFWHLPSHNPSASVYTKPVVRQVERIISLCNGAIASTQPLAKIMQKYNRNVMVAPNLIEAPIVARQPYTDRLKIGWGGTSTHVKDFSSKVISAMKHCQKAYNAQLVFLGYLPEAFANDPDVAFVKGVPVHQYMNQLHLADLEIALAPLEENYFNECKSNLKLLEYGICGSAVVASDSFAYKHTVEQGTTGFVVKKNGWMDALVSLCEDAELRNRIQGNMYQHVLQNYTWESRAAEIAAAYKSFIEAVA